MAYLVKRPRERVEIRESVSTPAGPRARMLASFVGVLRPETLEEAAREATRPFDPDAICTKAKSLGIPVIERRDEPELRAAIARLRADDPVDPVLLAALRDALGQHDALPVPEDSVDVVEWIGTSEAARAEALRGLLRASDRIVHARPTRPSREEKVFPRFSSRKRGKHKT